LYKSYDDILTKIDIFIKKYLTKTLILVRISP